jgi:hypothetical protein
VYATDALKQQAATQSVLRLVVKGEKTGSDIFAFDGFYAHVGSTLPLNLRSSIGVLFVLQKVEIDLTTGTGNGGRGESSAISEKRAKFEQRDQGNRNCRPSR